MMCSDSSTQWKIHTGKSSSGECAYDKVCEVQRGPQAENEAAGKTSTAEKAGGEHRVAIRGN